MEYPSVFVTIPQSLSLGFPLFSISIAYTVFLIMSAEGS